MGYFAYLLFWPVFGLRYLLLEERYPAGGFHTVTCSWDGWIPFWEIFVFPYFLWHLGVIGLHLWLCFRDKPLFIRYSRYLILTMTCSTVMFLLWPSCQNLRPETFLRDNIMTRAVEMLYHLDTNTNVCPSEHVIGAAGFYLGAVRSDAIPFPGKRTVAGVLAFLMAAATVFLKQHSVLDVLAALPICFVGYLAAFRKGKK